MKNIIEKILQTENSKEKQQILERFREFARKGKEKECSYIFRKALDYFEKGNDEEKIASLRVINRIFISLPCLEFGIDDSKTEVKYDEVLFAVYSCLKFLKNENGNLRLSSAYALDHLRIFLEGIDYVDLFFNLLSLREYEKDKKKRKTIEFCLDRIWCPLLEELIEANTPLEVKRMKINVKDADMKEKQLAKETENHINKMVGETKKYIKRILKLRGQHLLDENFILYVDNFALFQVSYELQRLMNMIRKKELSNDLADRYTKFRLSLCLKKNLRWLEKIKEKKEFIYVDLNLEKNKVYLSTIADAYSRFKNIYDGISHLADWSIDETSLAPKFWKQERKEGKISYIG